MDLAPDLALTNPSAQSVRRKGLFAPSELLSIAQIRTHTKTDDTPHVTDDQLNMYRQAAFESACHYTGLYLGPLTNVSEQVLRRRPPNEFPTSQRGWNQARNSKVVRHKTKYAFAEPYARSYGGVSGENLYTVELGSKVVSVRVTPSDNFTDPSCCHPCGGLNDGNNITILIYTVGYSNADEVPALVKVGMLKYIAWSVNRPGDELLTIRNRVSVNESGLTGTNNVAWASGALEMWRQLDVEAY
jgi:hypothetical protein